MKSCVLSLYQIHVGTRLENKASIHLIHTYSSLSLEEKESHYAYCYNFLTQKSVHTYSPLSLGEKESHYAYCYNFLTQKSVHTYSPLSLGEKESHYAYCYNFLTQKSVHTYSPLSLERERNHTVSTVIKISRTVCNFYNSRLVRLFRNLGRLRNLYVCTLSYPNRKGERPSPSSEQTPCP